VILERCAGVLIPLFSLRTREDFGRGETSGLLAMGDLALAMGHRLIQLLPINETAPDESSPYTALSVFAIDPVYASMRALPGIEASALATARMQTGGHGMPPHASVYAAKRVLLEAAYRFFTARAEPPIRKAFDAFVSSNRDWLDDYALFRALKEKFKWGAWETWPAGLRQRDPKALAEARGELADRVAMFSWFQFAAHREWIETRAQLATRGVMIGGDLAFSPGRESAEVWANQELFDCARSVGAPPDAFSDTGQRWGLPMPHWERMRASGFRFLRMRVRRARELYHALRVDHVVGLFRTYGYPLGARDGGRFDPVSEQAQRAQGEEILRVILEESGTMQIITEDLGVIPPFVRVVLATLGLPGYKVVRWEKTGWGGPDERFVDPSTYAEVSLATTGTHDTDTLAEWWRDATVEERQRLTRGLRLGDRAEPRQSVMDERTLDAILDALYASPSRLVIVPLPDLFGWTDRINTPGMVNSRNWTWRLPFDLESIGENPRLRERLAKLREIAQRRGRFRPIAP
jgi:4-alpha-glucanotransferase